MTTSLPCPRCQSPLSKTNDQFSQCESCQGKFMAGVALDPRWFVEPVTRAESTSLKCPGCQESMQALLLGETEIDHCDTCEAIWLDAGESPDVNDRGAIQRLMLYSLSLPERLVRSSVGVAAGAAKETASLLIPHSFQSAKTYELVVTNSLTFLTENVGGVAALPGKESADDDFMARKAVGNFVDLAGMATLHVSPVWLLAIVSDVAYGTSTYVQELAGELQQQGLIDDTSTIHHVDDVLDAIQASSGNAASLFDTPPLSVVQLRETLERTREAITAVDYTGVLPESELRSYWNEMQEISAEHGVSLLGVSGALAMNTLGKLETAAKGTLTSVRVVGGLFNRHVIGHYRDSLKTVHEKGLFESVRETSGPYVEAVWNNFADDKPTWTEDIVTGKLAVRGWKKVTGWLGG